MDIGLALRQRSSRLVHFPDLRLYLVGYIRFGPHIRLSFRKRHLQVVHLPLELPLTLVSAVAG